MLSKTQKLDDMMATAKTERSANGKAAKAKTAENSGEAVKDGFGGGKQNAKEARE